MSSSSRPDKGRWSLLIPFIGCGICLLLILLCYISPAGSYLVLGAQLIMGDWRRENPFPFPEGLPNYEIVFIPYTDPDEFSPRPPTLGFIHPDGTGQVEYTFELYSGAKSMWGLKIATSRAFYPRWSSKGFLLFSIKGVPPNVRMIDPSGRMYGEKCDTLPGLRLTFDPQGNILGPIYEFSQVYRDYEPYIQLGSLLIARHDLKNCRIDGAFYLPVSADPRFIWAIGENAEGWVVSYFHEFETHSDRIVLYHSLRNIHKFFPGQNPAFSDDGKWIAYYRPDGYLVVRDVETDEERVVVRAMDRPLEFWSPESSCVSMPGWSPDGEWLVYSSPVGRMYKVHWRSGQRVYLGYGCAPDWR